MALTQDGITHSFPTTNGEGIIELGINSHLGFNMINLGYVCQKVEEIVTDTLIVRYHFNKTEMDSDLSRSLSEQMEACVLKLDLKLTDSELSKVKTIGIYKVQLASCLKSKKLDDQIFIEVQVKKNTPTSYCK